MSEELRHRLMESASRSGRSLNREILERLEASLDDRAAADAAGGPARPHQPSRIGGEMTHRRRHVLVALVAALTVIAVAAAGVAKFALENESEQGAEPEFP